MESQIDNESYWHRSAGHAFSFDDELEEEDKFTGGSGAAASAASILNDDAISEASFDNSATGNALNLSIKSIISDEALSIILDEQTLDERIIPKGVSAEEELKLLRRQIQTTIYSPSTETTAQKLLLGKTVPFEVFKSLHEKQQLLDELLANGGGDGVIGILHFLRKSLNQLNFYKILQQRPKALHHYLSYLEQIQSPEAVQLLQHFGKRHEAALLQFSTSLKCEDLSARKQKLHHIVDSYSNDSSACNLYQQTFHATQKLLELVEKEQNALDNSVHLNSTPLEILYACCRKHSNWKEQDLVKSISPFRFAAEQQISPAQFEWTALNERTRAQAYADLESVFERASTWHPMKQKQFHISFTLDLAILRLYALNAPTSVLYLFLSKMSNSSEKLGLAQRVKCTKAAIDALAGMKDVAQLMELKETLPERSEEQFHCEKALKALQSKRWTTENIRLKLKE